MAQGSILPDSVIRFNGRQQTFFTVLKLPHNTSKLVLLAESYYIHKSYTSGVVIHIGEHNSFLACICSFAYTARSQQIFTLLYLMLKTKDCRIVRR